MNRIEARKLSEIITNSELTIMLINAKEQIMDWTKKSNVNKSMTKGTAWNILAKDFKFNYSYNNLTKTNMIIEFGEFLPEYILPKKKSKKAKNTKLVHHEPDFSGWIGIKSKRN